MSLFRHVALFAQSVANATPALTIVERLALLRAPHQMPLPVVIVGCPRSGTTLLYEVLTSALTMAYPSNIASMLYRAPVLASVIANAVVQEHRPRFKSDLGYVSGLLAPSEAGALMRHWFTGAKPLAKRDPDTLQRLAASLTRVMGGPLILKNLYLDQAFDLVLSAFQGCIVLRMTRDERFTAQSMLIARQREVGEKAAWWGPKPEGFEQALGWSIPSQIAWQVSRIERSIDRLVEDERVAGRVINCDYEKLCMEPMAFVRSFSDFYTEVAGVSLTNRGEIPSSFPVSSRKTVPDVQWDELVSALAQYGLPKFETS